jgi:hypothetical protein
LKLCLKGISRNGRTTARREEKLGGAWMRLAPLILGVALGGCFSQAETPLSPRSDATSGHLRRAFDRVRVCGAWSDEVGTFDETALSHVSFPELDPRGCYVRVHHEDGRVYADPTPPGCGFPDRDASTSHFLNEAARYEDAALGRGSAKRPLPIACGLPADVMRAAAQVNATTLRRLAEHPSTERFPYAAVATFGFGRPAQGASSLLSWRPGAACPALSKAQMDILSLNIVRAGRAAEARNAHVAPVVILSGGAVHSPLYEAFLLDYLVTCHFGVRQDAVLLDPCADHTHTNLRNTGALVAELGGRTAYVVTDDGLQGIYLQDWTTFNLIGGSIDQRSLRDFGYLVGAYRRASVGIASGFWFTPYRFWAEPWSGPGGLQCDE